MRDIGLLTIIIILASIALRHPIVGLLAFVGMGLINPHTFTWGFGRTFPFSSIMALSTIVGYMFSAEPKRLPRQREVYLLLALWGLYSLSTYFAVFPHRGFLSDDALEKWKYISKILLMVFLTMSLINTQQRLIWLVRVIALSLGFFAIKGGVFAIMTGGSWMVWGPVGTFLYANNAIGLAMAMNVPILLYLRRMETYSKLRKLMVVMMAFSYPAVIATYSRGAWVALAGVTGLLFLKAKYRVLFVVVGGIFALVALPFLGVALDSELLPDRVVTRFDQLVNYEEEASAQSRFWNWELCRRVGFANPLVGEGFNFYNKDMYYKYYPQFIEEWGDQVWSCHSMWLTVLAEHGIIAFLLWIILICSCLLSVRRFHRLSRTFPELSWADNIGKMIQASFVVYMISGTFLDIAYFDLFYQLIAVVIIVKDQVRQQLGKLTFTSPKGSRVARHPSQEMVLEGAK